MSVVSFRGEGDVALACFLYKHRYRRPFLQRNARSLIAMGKAISSMRSPRPRVEPAASEDEEDEDPRPAKRRRINYYDDSSRVSQNGDDSGFRKPLGQVTTNEGSRSLVRLPGKPGLLQPSDFYGKPRPVTPALSNPSGALSKSSKTSINTILNKTPTQFKQSLRVDIVEISPASAVDVEAFAIAHPRKTQIDIKCRCSVMIFYAKNDENPGDVRPSDYAEVCRLTKFCTLRITFGEDEEISRQFVMSEPFVFQSDQFHVNRRLRKPNGQWSPFKFDFADKYNLQVLVEPVGSHKDWPPVDIPTVEQLQSIEDGPPSPISAALEEQRMTYDELHLFCKTEARLDALLDPERQNRLLELQMQNANRTAKQVLPYTLKLVIKWAIPSHLYPQSLPLRTAKMEESSRAILPPPPSANVLESPVRRLREDISASNSPADRSQRRRSNVPTYNLKALSAQAQGKSPRVRRIKDFKTGLRPGDEDIMVTYTFGKADAAETGVKQTTVIPGLECPFCNSHCSQVDDLRLHLHTDHTMFKFHLRKGSPPRISFFVEVCKSRAGPTMSIERQKTIQFGKPMSLFDLEKTLGGDETWAKGRHGPLHNTWPDHLLDRAHDSSLSSSPHESRHSSPNTSNDTDDLMEFEASELMKLPVRPRKVFYVPKTAKPLYDTITKRILQPGEELPNSDDEKEEGWLRQKSRDLINDFTDVTLEEKDFINTYNPFIINEHLTSPKYLPEALIRFADSHKTWFTEKRSRKKEFVKLMEVFILRGVVEEKTLERCVDILRAAARANKGKDIDMNDAAPAKPRALMDCICGEHTQPPNRVICRGAVSFRASFLLHFANVLLALPRTILPSYVRGRGIRTTYHGELEMQSLSFLSICCIIEA
jgi:VEFS-Box of polycomb protein